MRSIMQYKGRVKVKSVAARENAKGYVPPAVFGQSSLAARAARITLTLPPRRHRAVRASGSAGGRAARG
jgi:hypothetical protein